ncbi:hypothetical protein [Mycoplasmoides alvi]|uniref:hypothetical protein n=1 Tax=Mycoplasmoides alvi TaxID=78580 RepID=UPI00051C3BD2|nr:hypothetical protein [Mycoplasmoides alvi]
MLQIYYQNNWHNLDFNGIKILETTFPTHFIKSILTDDNENHHLVVDSKVIKWKNVIYVNELSKYSDFLSLSKSNVLYKKIVEIIGDKTLIDNNLVNFVINKINKDFQINDLLIPQYDVYKLINSSMEINDISNIDSKTFFDFFLKLEFDEKKLIIFDNVKNATYKNCQKLLNNFNVLIITTDIREVINHFNELEICAYVKENDFFEIIDIDKLISYLEMKTSLPIDQKDLNNFLSKHNDEKSHKINFFLKNI